MKFLPNYGNHQNYRNWDCNNKNYQIVLVELLIPLNMKLLNYLPEIDLGLEQFSVQKFVQNVNKGKCQIFHFYWDHYDPGHIYLTCFQ